MKTSKWRKESDFASDRAQRSMHQIMTKIKKRSDSPREAMKKRRDFLSQLSLSDSFLSNPLLQGRSECGRQRVHCPACNTRRNRRGRGV